MVALAVSAAGDICLPVIIFKGKWQFNCICPQGCVDYVQEKTQLRKFRWINNFMSVTDHLPNKVKKKWGKKQLLFQVDVQQFYNDWMSTLNKPIKNMIAILSHCSTLEATDSGIYGSSYKVPKWKTIVSAQIISGYRHE